MPDSWLVEKPTPPKPAANAGAPANVAAAQVPPAPVKKPEPAPGPAAPASAASPANPAKPQFDKPAPAPAPNQDSASAPTFSGDPDGELVPAKVRPEEATPAPVKAAPVPDQAVQAEKLSPPVPAAPIEVKKALPVASEAPKTPMDIALWQVALERKNFSCGTIDGHLAMRSTRAIREYQANQGLPQSGLLDDATRAALNKPGDAFVPYTVTAPDMGKVDPTPSSFLEKSKKLYLGYNDPWEMLGEKFHSSPDFLKKLNPGVAVVTVGTALTVPNLGPATALPKAALIHIRLSETTLTVKDVAGKTVACFPCSIAKDKNKRPNGKLVVAVVVPDPNYTFNPDVLKEAAQKEGITRKLILPPGPNNPVGLAWIGLSLPGYGIHGTPEPSAISRTGSMGCFRLANWNAQKLLRMVSIGVPVEVEE